MTVDPDRVLALRNGYCDKSNYCTDLGEKCNKCTYYEVYPEEYPTPKSFFKPKGNIGDIH